MSDATDLDPHARIAALEAEVAGHRRLLANMPGMVYQFLLRPDGWMGFTFASEGAREVYGLEPDAIVRDYRAAFDLVHRDDVASFMRSVRRSAADLSPYKWEGRLLRDDRTRWIQAASRPHRQPDGGILWDGVILDITQRKEADAALAHSFRQDETIRLQTELLAQLAAPLIPLTSRVALMPLVGAVDLARAARILEVLLQGVERHRVAVILLDVTGVPTLDGDTAAALGKAARAAALLGAEVLLTGVRPEAARALVDAGADLSGVRTLGTLQAAVAEALAGRR